MRYFFILLFLVSQFATFAASAGDKFAVPQPAASEAATPTMEADTKAAGSPQRAKTGTGGSAGSAAGQTLRRQSGFLSTTLIIGIVVVGATAAIALEAASDSDTIPSTTSTTGTN